MPHYSALDSIDKFEEKIHSNLSAKSVIFKHSSRCSISNMAKARLDRTTFPPQINFYLLDVLKDKKISNYIADKLAVVHESPQVLILENGKCTYVQNHNGITGAEILEQLKA